MPRKLLFVKYNSGYLWCRRSTAWTFHGIREFHVLENDERNQYSTPMHIVYFLMKTSNDVENASKKLLFVKENVSVIIDHCDDVCNGNE